MTKEKEHVRLYFEFTSHRVASSLVVMMEETVTRPDIHSDQKALSLNGEGGGVMSVSPWILQLHPVTTDCLLHVAFHSVA